MRGSSPLTRGKQNLRYLRWNEGRLIPAHAGKTNVRVPELRHHEAHPRSRGENAILPLMMLAEWGSSPLTRGKRDRGALRDVDERLIPAHAGKTPPWMRRARASRAHPRSRGENGQPVVDLIINVGSSPLTRGKRLEAEDVAGPGGLIPAHAGKTSGFARRKLGAGAHPRSRGENVAKRSPVRGLLGSSPLTRGKLVAHS